VIGYIKGNIIEILHNSIVVDVHGVGYEIKTPQTSKLELFHEITLWICTKVSENDISLYGFVNQGEKTYFDLLNTVSGVGPKTALAILSNLPIIEINTAIESDNVNLFLSIPGIGRKNATRIIIELKNKISRTEVNLNKLTQNSQIDKDISAALKKFGYSKQEINHVLKQIDLTESTDTIIKKALKLL